MKTYEKLVAPSAISDKTVVRMKLTDSCVLGERVLEEKLDFHQNQMDLSEGSMTSVNRLKQFENVRLYFKTISFAGPLGETYRNYTLYETRLICL